MSSAVTATATATATATKTVPLSKKDKLWEIIQNGRQFLTALEKFASTTNFSDIDNNDNDDNSSDDDDEEGMTSRLHRALQDDSESARLFDEVEKCMDDDNKNNSNNNNEGNGNEGGKRLLPVPREEENLTPAAAGLVQMMTTPAATETTTATTTPTTTTATTTTQPLQQQQQRTPTTATITTTTRRRAIAQFCAKTGTVLGHYPSTTAAAESLAASMPAGTRVATWRGAINDVLSGQRKKAPMYKGFYFRYIGDTTTPMPKFPIERRYHQSKYSTTTTAPAETTTTTTTNTTDPRIPTTTTTTTTIATATRGDANYGRQKRKRLDRSCSRVPILQFCAKTGKQLGRFETTAAAAKSIVALLPPPPENDDNNDDNNNDDNNNDDNDEYEDEDDYTITTLEERFRNGISKIINGYKKRPSFRGYYFRDANDIMTPFPSFPIPEPKRAEWAALDVVAAATPRNGTDNTTTTTSTTTTMGTTTPLQASTRRRKKKRKKAGRNRPVLQFCAKTGEQLGQFDSQSQAATQLAKESTTTTTKIITETPLVELYRGGMSKALNGFKKNGVYAGFYFRYADDTESPMPTFPIATRLSSSSSSKTAAASTTTTNPPQEQEPGNDDDDDDDDDDHEALQPIDDTDDTNTGTTAARKEKKGGRNRPVLQICPKTGRQLGRFDCQAHAAVVLAEKVSTTTSGRTVEATTKLIRTGISKALNGFRKNGLYMGSHFRYEDDIDSPMPTFPIGIRVMTRRRGQQQQRLGRVNHDDDDL